jgi:hypothetical protein
MSLSRGNAQAEVQWLMTSHVRRQQILTVLRYVERMRCGPG